LTFRWWVAPLHEARGQADPERQIHISKAAAAEEQVTLASKAVKLMHRFTPEQVQAKMDEAESK
jgi:hypothetical protein